MLNDARALGGRDRAGRVRGGGVDDQDSSSSGYRSCISRIARRTMGPIVSSSLSVGSTRLTVMPCFSLSAVSRARSPNSLWWKFASANQRSTSAGTAARFLGGPVGGDQRLGLLGQLLERLAADGLARLDHDDGRLRALGDGLRERPEQRPADLAGRCGCAHHHQVGALGLAQDRGADVRRLAQERLGAGGDELARERARGRARPGCGPPR